MTEAQRKALAAAKRLRAELSGTGLGEARAWLRYSRVYALTSAAVVDFAAAIDALDAEGGSDAEAD